MSPRRALVGLGMLALAGCTIEPRADTRGGASLDVESVTPDTASVITEGIVWTAADPGARLPGALAPADEPGGLGWTLVDRRVSSLGEARLVLSRYRADIAGEPMGWWAVETLLLVEQDGRWRVRHLHRSRGPQREGPP
jgi:hypothetical protein